MRGLEKAAVAGTLVVALGATLPYGAEAAEVAGERIVAMVNGETAAAAAERQGLSVTSAASADQAPQAGTQPPEQQVAGLPGWARRALDLGACAIIACSNGIDGNPKTQPLPPRPSRQERIERQQKVDDADPRKGNRRRGGGPPLRLPGGFLLFPWQQKYLEDYDRCGGICPEPIDSSVPGEVIVASNGGWPLGVVPEPEQPDVSLTEPVVPIPDPQPDVSLTEPVVPIPLPDGEIGAEQVPPTIGALPDAVDDGIAPGVVGAIGGAINGRPIDDIAVGVGAGVADEVVTDALDGLDIPVPGVAGAAGNLVASLINGVDLDDLAVDTAIDIGTSSLLSTVGAAAPIAGPLLGVITSALTGDQIPGPGSVFGSVLGAVFGGPLGGLVGGLLGGLLDGFLGWGKPSSFTITEDVDVTGDGEPDEITGLLDDDGIGYSVPVNELLAQNHPFRQATYKLREYSAVAHEGVLKNPEECHGTCRESGIPGTHYFLESRYEFEPLFPTTGTAGFGEGLPVWQSDGERSYDILEGGREITEAEYLALAESLGGVSGSVPGSDPRFEQLRTYMPRYSDEYSDKFALRFDQADKEQGIYFRQDLNGDGVPEVLRTFPKIEDFLDGDGRTELVGVGVPRPT